MYTTILSLLFGATLALPNGVKSSSSSSSTYTSICQSGKYNSLEQNARVSPGQTPIPSIIARLHTKLTKHQFDNDQNAIPLAPDAPIDLYLDLYYNGMALDQITLGPNSIGVEPQSPPNVATFANGEAVTILQGQPKITTVYADSTVVAFDFHSFYFGIVLGSENSAASTPMSGSVTVTGIDTNGKTVAVQTFAFVANGLQQQMVKAVLGPQFSCLRDAVFEINGPAGLLGATGNATLAVLADNFESTVYGYGFGN